MEILQLPRQSEADLTFFSSSELFGRSLPLELSKREHRRRAFRKPTLESPRMCVRFSFQGPRQVDVSAGFCLGRGVLGLSARLVNSFFFPFALQRAVGESFLLWGGDFYFADSVSSTFFVSMSSLCGEVFETRLATWGRRLLGRGFRFVNPCLRFVLESFAG